MAAQIRLARSKDVDALADIENTAFTSDRISKKSFRRLIASRSASVLVADGGGPIDGYCVVLFRTGSRQARLYSLAARPGNGRLGLGRSLLGAAEQAVTRRGCEALRLEVRRDNARAIRLYEAGGFRLTGVRPCYYADGHDALLYEKQLGRLDAVTASIKGELVRQ